MVINIKNLSYSYKLRGQLIKALCNLNLEVNQGEIFGFIGPNGAGKTTTIKLLLGILRSNKDNIKVFDNNPTNVKVHHRIGYMPEIAYYYDYLTVVELLYMYGCIFNIKKSELKIRIKHLLELVDLQEDSNRLMHTFSKGMMQRVSFAQALINNPDLLILDEPTSGLDPIARLNMRKIILDLNKKGTTIFFSSHELSEVELISNKIGIINKGQMLAVGTVKDLLGEKKEEESLENYFLKIIGETK